MAARTDTHLELPIAGMTCASCANRIERELNALDGVSASVNYATEKAAVDFDTSAVVPQQLVAAVEAAGYRARLPAAEPAPAPPETRRRRCAGGSSSPPSSRCPSCSWP